jgi:hypothetical protein
MKKNTLFLIIFTLFLESCTVLLLNSGGEENKQPDFFNLFLLNTLLRTASAGAGTGSTTVVPYVVLKTAQTTTYATGDDGQYQLGRARTYSDNSNGTITEVSTGLVWQKCSAGLSGTTCATGSASTFTWANALSYCNSLSFAGRTWRLPTVNELANLVDYSRAASPVVNTTFFPATVANYYWSSTTYAPFTTYAWYVFFDNGTVDSFFKTNNFYVRCISGQ